MWIWRESNPPVCDRFGRESVGQSVAPWIANALISAEVAAWVRGGRAGRRSGRRPRGTARLGRRHAGGARHRLLSSLIRDAGTGRTNRPMEGTSVSTGRPHATRHRRSDRPAAGGAGRAPARLGSWRGPTRRPERAARERGFVEARRGCSRLLDPPSQPRRSDGGSEPLHRRTGPARSPRPKRRPRWLAVRSSRCGPRPGLQPRIVGEALIEQRRSIQAISRREPACAPPTLQLPERGLRRGELFVRPRQRGIR